MIILNFKKLGKTFNALLITKHHQFAVPVFENGNFNFFLSNCETKNLVLRVSSRECVLEVRGNPRTIPPLSSLSPTTSL
jgi:hypothetical protein